MTVKHATALAFVLIACGRRAIGACGCALADLDGFVSLFAWLTLPMPELGWVPIERFAREP